MGKARAWRTAAVAAVASAISAAAVAEPLAKEACDTAEAERARLLADGVQDAIRKGPVWAKANLPPQKLEAVARYIALQEDLLFKCGHAKLRTLPANDVEDSGDGVGAAKDTPAEPPVAPKRKSPPRKAAQAKTGPSANTADAAAPKVAAQPRPKPKPKVDDAFRPPQPIPQPATE